MMMMMMIPLGGMVIGLKSIDNDVYRSLHIPLISSTRQDILGNIVKEVLNGVTRIVGWGLTTLVRSRKKGEGISKKNGKLQTNLCQYKHKTSKALAVKRSVTQVLYGNVFDSGR